MHSSLKRPDELEKKLYDLSRHDTNIEKVEALLMAGVDVNAKVQNSTALLRAASSAQPQMVSLLLQHGADKDAIDYYGNSLTQAIFPNPNAHKVVEILIEAGVNPCVPNSDGETPLHKATDRGDIEMVRKLIPLYSNLNVMCKRLFTPLYNAAMNESEEVVKLLLSLGAAPNLPLGDYQKPVLWYVKRNHMDEIAQILEEYGAKAELILSPARIKFTSDKIPNITESQADTYIPPVDADGMTPLHHAVKNGNISQVEELISKYTNLDLKDKKSATPLYYAAIAGNIYIAKALLEAGAAPNIPTVIGKTALWHAAYEEKVGIVKFFVQSGITLKNEVVEESNETSINSIDVTTELDHLSLEPNGNNADNLVLSDDIMR